MMTLDEFMKDYGNVKVVFQFYCGEDFTFMDKDSEVGLQIHVNIKDIKEVMYDGEYLVTELKPHSATVCDMWVLHPEL